LITISRRTVLKLRTVLRRAFGARGPGPTLVFTADSAGLKVSARQGDVAVEFCDQGNGEGSGESLRVPFAFLADCGSKSDDPVELVPHGKHRVVTHWVDRNVPQRVTYDADPPANADKFPLRPENFTENPPELLQALRDAAATTDPESARYALGCIQLRASGTLTATDGRQILVQSGFQFPWETDILIPANKIFCAAELPCDQPVRVGKTEDWVALGVGPWMICLAINKEGRFPDVDRHLPRADMAQARCRFSAGDAVFLGETLPRLPGQAEYNFPVTFDLNGSIAVRAKAGNQAQATEVVLTDSEWSGDPTRINTNRQYLKRALSLGFREIFLFGEESPVFCQDEHRRYGWALLESKSAIGPAEDVIRLESPKISGETITTTTLPPRRTTIVSQSIHPQNSSSAVPAKSNGHAKTKAIVAPSTTTRPPASRQAGRRNLGELLDQAEAVRLSLRDALSKTNELVKGLKSQRRLSRSVESTLASLRQLQTLEV
jgi:hypothetical protein